MRVFLMFVCVSSHVSVLGPSVLDCKSLKSRHGVPLEYVYSKVAEVSGVFTRFDEMCLTSSLATEALILPSPPSLLFLLEINCPWDEMMSFERDEMQSEYDLHYPILIPLSFSDFAG